MIAIGLGQFLLDSAWHLALLALLAAGSAFFSAAETALFSLSRADMFHLSHDPRRMARLVPALMRKPSDVLATILLATDAVNIMYFVISTLLALEVEQHVEQGAWLGPILAAVLLLALVALAEVVPKTLAFVAPRQLAPLAAPMLAVLTRVLRVPLKVLSVAVIEPLTRLLAPVRNRQGDLSEEELSSLLALSQEHGLIGHSEGDLLQQVLELTERKAGDVMVPRVDMIAFPAGGTGEALLDLVRRRRISKVPVYQGDLDHVVGLVSVKRLLARPQASVAELTAPVQFVPESAPLEKVLLQMRVTRSQVAIVVDEYGGTAGLITLNDVLEELVGEITGVREGHQAPAVTPVGKNEWLVRGDLPIHEWAHAFPTDLSDARFTTVGGFVVSLLGRVPREGQTARYRNITFTVERMDHRRIGQLRVRLGEASP